MAELPREATHRQRGLSARAWIWLLALAAIVLVSSWAIAWAMPAPKVCVSIDCGMGFNSDQIHWRVLSFWNWQQLVVVLLGLALTVSIVVMATRARSHTDRPKISQ